MLFFLKKPPHTIYKSNVMMIFTREELCGQNTFILKPAYLNKAKRQISVDFVGVSNFIKPVTTKVMAVPRVKARAISHAVIQDLCDP